VPVEHVEQVEQPVDELSLTPQLLQELQLLLFVWHLHLRPQPLRTIIPMANTTMAEKPNRRRSPLDMTDVFIIYSPRKSVPLRPIAAQDAGYLFGKRMRVL